MSDAIFFVSVALAVVALLALNGCINDIKARVAELERRSREMTPP